MTDPDNFILSEDSLKIAKLFRPFFFRLSLQLGFIFAEYYFIEIYCLFFSESSLYVTSCDLERC